MTRFARTIVFAIAAACAAAAVAEDAYYNIPVGKLKLVEGSLPKPKGNSLISARLRALRPYATLDGQGEAYVDDRSYWTMFRVPGVDSPPLVIRTPAGKDVAGRLFVANAERSGMVALRFFVPASAAEPDSRDRFAEVKIFHYASLVSREIPGGAWFRHQLRSAQAALGEKSDGLAVGRARGAPRNLSDPPRTYELFSGGRAMSENLQLDRELPPLRSDEKPVKTDSLTGITTQEIDWKPLIKDAKPKLDPLAAKIPADQHVVFFASFDAAMAVADETRKHDTPVLRLAQPRSEDAGVVARYERQLGLPASTLARLLGPALAKSVALTGSDPYFPMGTDVAVLFESPQPAVLKILLSNEIGGNAGTFHNMLEGDVKPASGEVDGLTYAGFLTSDRHVSSYIAQLDGAVVVTNSLYQLRRLAAVSKGTVKSIASLPEYTFFRTRYPLGDADETALVFLSDATIRRWCGPRWRIADSRRIRAAAVLAELQAAQHDLLVKKTVKPGPIYTDLPILGGGQLQLTEAGVLSPTFGTLTFMTPIGEMPLDEVTQAEADAYRTWAAGYQRNWNWAFDPIALRIGLGKQKLAADLSVMPLIVGTEYRDFTSFTLGGKFGPTTGDPHDALLHLILAVNRQSPAFRSVENMATMFVQGVALGWIGEAISIYADDDPFWGEVAKLKESELSKFMQENIGRLPVAVRVESSNPLKLAAFLTGLRAFSEQSAPGLLAWESLKYKEQPYVRISPAKGSKETPHEWANLAIYYTPLDGALTVTLNEKVLQHAIDRFLARKESQGKAAGKETRPWLGSNVGLRVDSRILDLVNAAGRQHYEEAMQTQCWNNLPILNEWKRRYPDRNPVEVHKQTWGVELVCPGGGKYVWNEKYQTMESTVYGHPGQPKSGPAAPPVLSTFANGQFGLTFENQGLRARVELEK